VTEPFVLPGALAGREGWEGIGEEGEKVVKLVVADRIRYYPVHNEPGGGVLPEDDRKERTWAGVSTSLQAVKPRGGPKRRGKVVYVSTRDLVGDEGRIIRRTDLSGQGLVRRGRRHQPTGVEIGKGPRLWRVTRPTDKQVAVVYDEERGLVRAVPANQVSLLGVRDPALHYSTQLRRGALSVDDYHQGGGQVFTDVSITFCQTSERASWWSGEGSVGRNVRPAFSERVHRQSRSQRPRHGAVGQRTGNKGFLTEDNIPF